MFKQGRTPLLLLLILTLLTGCGSAVPADGILVQRPVTVQPPTPPPPPPPPTVNLVFVGDIMLARTPGVAVEKGQIPSQTGPRC